MESWILSELEKIDVPRQMEGLSYLAKLLGPCHIGYIWLEILDYLRIFWFGRVISKVFRITAQFSVHTKR